MIDAENGDLSPDCQEKTPKKHPLRYKIIIIHFIARSSKATNSEHKTGHDSQFIRDVKVDGIFQWNSQGARIEENREYKK